MRARSKLYIQEICSRLNCALNSVAPLLAQRLEGNDATLIKGARSKLYRYANGGDIKDEKLLFAIETALPGTYRLVKHPIWALLLRNDHNPTELIELTQRLTPAFSNVFLTNAGEYDDRVAFKTPFTQKQYGLLYNTQNRLTRAKQMTLDSLAADLIAIRLTDSKKDLLRSLQSRRFAQFTLVQMAKTDRFQRFAAGVYQHVHCRYVDTFNQHYPKSKGIAFELENISPVPPLVLEDLIFGFA